MRSDEGKAGETRVNATYSHDLGRFEFFVAESVRRMPGSIPAKEARQRFCEFRCWLLHWAAGENVREYQAGKVEGLNYFDEPPGETSTLLYFGGSP